MSPRLQRREKLIITLASQCTLKIDELFVQLCLAFVIGALGIGADDIVSALERGEERVRWNVLRSDEEPVQTGENGMTQGG